MTRAIGIGLTGTPTPSNTASSLCSAHNIDRLVVCILAHVLCNLSFMIPHNSICGDTLRCVYFIYCAIHASLEIAFDEVVTAGTGVGDACCRSMIVSRVIGA